MTAHVPPRVLIAITQSELGGAQRYVLRVAQDLVRRGAYVAIACGQTGPLTDAASALGIDTHVIPTLVRPIRPWSDLRATIAFARLVKRGRFDVVHVNSTKAGIVGRLAARIAGTKTIFFTVHGLVLNEPMPKPMFACYWLMEWIGARCTTRLFAVSEADRAALVRYRIASDSRIAVIHNGIAPSAGSSALDAEAKRNARMNLGIDEQASVIGTVANFYRTKALDLLIESAPALIARHPDLYVCIVGDGPERRRLELRIAALGLEDRILRPGMRDDARSLLPAFDVFVLPSRKEGLPLALLEAMDAGLPVVVTRVGGMPEVVTNDCGFVVAGESASELGEALLTLIEDPATARRLGLAAHNRVRSHFSEGEMLASIAAEYAAAMRSIAAESIPWNVEGHAYEPNDR
ncbi:MAG: glycosyltransferase family 4 protein [Thermomicrobiales bacterium]|nr:glycosyltransferase family 4 protein [Thermomicrobiales bacterium]